MGMSRSLAVIVVAVFAGAVLTLSPCSTRADEELAVLGDLRVTKVSATPARAGGTTVITLIAENVGTDPIHITGVRLANEAPSRVMGSFGSGVSGDISQLRVAPGEAEQLDGKKVWIEVGPLARDLEPNSIEQARLLLESFDAPLTLHVVSSEADNGGQIASAATTGTVRTAGARRAGC
jgi:hypothetical protein